MQSYHDNLILQFDDDITGNAASNQLVTVFDAGTTVKPALFDVFGSPIANPVTTDSKGNYSFSIANGTYDIVARQGTPDETRRDEFIISVPGFTNGVKTFDTLTEAIEDTGLVDGDTVKYTERSTGNGGGASGKIVLSTTVIENTFDIVQCTGVPTLSFVLDIGMIVDPRKLGAISYLGLRAAEPSASAAINMAYQIQVETGAILSLGSLSTKYFIDAEILIDGRKPNINGGILECLAAYTGNMFHLKATGANTSVDDGVISSFKLQTTLEDDPSKTRAQKEGQYVGILHDTSTRAVFNVRFTDYFIQRPLVALQWDGNDGSGDDFSTTIIHTRGSYLGYKTLVQVKSTAGIVGEQQLNNCAFFEQRTTPSTLFDIQKGTSFMVNGCYYWNDGDQTSTLFNITALSRASVVVIKGGYWEVEAFDFLHPQVSIDGNFKITTKPGGGVAANAVINQPNITGGQVDNMILADPIHWVTVSGTNTDAGDKFQARPLSTITGTVRYDIGDEATFADLQNMTFSMWMEADTALTAGLQLIVNYTDASSDTFSSAFAVANGKLQLVGVDLSTTGLDIGKTPSRIQLLAFAGTGTAKVGIPVCSRSATMPLYSVPLLSHLSKEKEHILDVNNAAPLVRDGYFFITANTVATTLTDFFGFSGQTFSIRVNDANTSIDLTNANNIRGNNPTGGISVYALALSDVIEGELRPNGRWYVSILRGSGA